MFVCQQQIKLFTTVEEGAVVQFMKDELQVDILGGDSMLELDITDSGWLHKARRKAQLR
jgi:hypothetical protein